MEWRKYGAVVVCDIPLPRRCNYRKKDADRLFPEPFFNIENMWVMGKLKI